MIGPCCGLCGRLQGPTDHCALLDSPPARAASRARTRPDSVAVARVNRWIKVSVDIGGWVRFSPGRPALTRPLSLAAIFNHLSQAPISSRCPRSILLVLEEHHVAVTWSTSHKSSILDLTPHARRRLPEQRPPYALPCEYHWSGRPRSTLRIRASQPTFVLSASSLAVIVKFDATVCGLSTVVPSRGPWLGQCRPSA